MPDKTPFHRCTGKRCLRCWQNKLRHATKHDRDEANKINYPNEFDEDIKYCIFESKKNLHYSTKRYNQVI